MSPVAIVVLRPLVSSGTAGTLLNSSIERVTGRAAHSVARTLWQLAPPAVQS